MKCCHGLMKAVSKNGYKRRRLCNVGAVNNTAAAGDKTILSNSQSKKLYKKKKRRERNKKIVQNWQLYVLILPAFLYFLIYGIQIAFKDFTPAEGIFNSAWIGFEHFTRFFESYYFWDLIKNTLGISVYELIVGFPLPIILALALNEAKDGLYKKSVQ